MHDEKIRKLLQDIAQKKISVQDAIKKLKFLPFEDIGFAKIDHHRTLRKGFPEVVFCQNKTKKQVLGIIKRLACNNSDLLATRATVEMYDEVKKHLKNAEYNELARTITIKKTGQTTDSSSKKILVISAGTSDIPVAEEAAVTSEIMGNNVERLYDVGVAGIHRLLAGREKIENAEILIVVAGMDGVLPSVVGGLVGKPIIAVPTSVGYGASFKGIAPLLTMLNSCSPGIVVVNIDNGFGAGYFASLIIKTLKK